MLFYGLALTDDIKYWPGRQLPKRVPEYFPTPGLLCISYPGPDSLLNNPPDAPQYWVKLDLQIKKEQQQSLPRFPGKKISFP